MCSCVNKGIENCRDDNAVNEFVEEVNRPLPFERRIYLGDGGTDIPSRKMIRYQDGYSIAVFDNEKWSQEGIQKKIEKLISEERANHVIPALYNAQ